MKSLEEFREAGQQLQRALIYPGVEGVDEHGNSVVYSWDDDDPREIDVFKKNQPSHMAGKVNVRTFIQGLGMGIAKQRNERLGSIFSDEVDVFVGAVLVIKRRNQATLTLESAIRDVEAAAQIGPASLVPRHIISSVSAVEAERMARLSESNLVNTYVRYEQLAISLEGAQA